MQQQRSIYLIHTWHPTDPHDYDGQDDMPEGHWLGGMRIYEANEHAICLRDASQQYFSLAPKGGNVVIQKCLLTVSQTFDLSQMLSLDAKGD